jgi:ribonuclease-3
MRPLNSDLSATFITALTHPTWSAEHGGPHYQRLEYLGDGLIKGYVASQLYDRHPDEDEGGLSRRLHQLVSRQTLAAAARTIGLDDRDAGLGRLVRLGKSERKGHQNTLPDRLLEELFEAWVGATYLESGDTAARRLVLEALDAVRDELPEVESPKDLLQRRTQAAVSDVPRYSAEREPGSPDHAPRWRATVRLPRPLSGEAQGVGDTKGAAEHAAARALLAEPPSIFTVVSEPTHPAPAAASGTKNHRQRLKEWCDISPGGPPRWEKEIDIGTVTTPRFRAQVCRGERCGEGEGSNKPQARESAAAALLRAMGTGA